MRLPLDADWFTACDVKLWRHCELSNQQQYGPKSKTERPTKTKIGTEVAHVARDSDITFEVKGQLV